MRIRFEFIIVLIAVISLSFYMFGPISDDSVGAASRISPFQKSRISASSRYAVPPLVVSTNKTNTTSPKIYIPSTTLCGDVNGDGRVATVDSMILSQVSAGLAILKPGYAECADVNRDGRIDTRDSLIVAQMSVGTGRGNCPAGCRTVTQCSDSVDNDGDTLIDFPRDTGCKDIYDNDEHNRTFQCDDGVDNDRDGLIDYPRDKGCYFTLDKFEYANCSDSIDNDLDRYIDYPNDTQCFGPDDHDEKR